MAFNAGAYEQQKGSINQQFGAQMAAANYGRRLGMQRGSRNISNLRRDYSAQTPRVISSFGQRGLAGPGVQSGTYGQALSDYAARHYQQVQQERDGMAEVQRDFMTTRADLRAQRQDALARLRMQQSMEIAQAAALLSQFQQTR